MQPAILDKLRGIVGGAHVFTGIELSSYVVEGRTPDVAVFPGSVEAVQSVVALAAESETPLMPWGGGTAATVGMPPARTGIVLGLARLDRLVEHEPGDLTATVQAGMTVERLQTALRERGQWLSLDPPDADRATLGGVIAANASGPRRHLYGTARDQLIGITVVTAEGALVRGGGKVVKNVAGYDLPKLFVGSYGTLGVIVELTVRLRPLPEVERWVRIRFDHLKDAGVAVRAIMGADLIPTAIELLDAEASRALGLESAPTLLVAFDGLPEQVGWQCTELAAVTAPLGGHGVAPLPDSAPVNPGPAWTSASGLVAVTRFSVLPALITELMEHGAGAARQRGLQAAWTSHAGVGVVTAALFSTSDRPELKAVATILEEWRGLARSGGGHATLEWAPLAVKAQTPVWDDLGAAGRVMQRIKVQLDPKGILNSGRFVAGI
ncbi:MAG: FAD-binding oxidoreductase [Candidatus Rokuibacteriota bacterium]